MYKPENIKNSYTRDELVLCGTGELLGSETARLPSGNMLMVDRVVEINKDGGLHGLGYIEAELDIHPDLKLLLALKNLGASNIRVEMFQLDSVLLDHQA